MIKKPQASRQFQKITFTHPRQSLFNLARTLSHKTAVSQHLNCKKIQLHQLRKCLNHSRSNWYLRFELQHLDLLTHRFPRFLSAKSPFTSLFKEVLHAKR